MRRRITLAIVGAVALALVLTGAGTVVLSRFEAQRSAQSELVADAQSLVPVLEQQLTAETEIARLRERIGGAQGADRTRLTPQQRGALLRRLGKRFHLEDEAVLLLGPDALRGTPPEGVALTTLTSPQRIAALRAGRATSGRSGSLTWAAVPTSAPGPSGRRLVVALTRKVQLRSGALDYFLVAASVVLVLAVLVAFRLSRRLIRPLREADHAARRIADSDLSARVPDPPVRATDELADLSRAINHMAENLERSRGLERQFLLSVSHDLRTPLTSIRGYAEAITDGAVDDAAAAAGVISSESRRLERLVRDLLDLAKLDAREFSLSPVVLDAAALAARSAAGFRRPAHESGLHLRTDLPESPCWVTADPDRLAQVVANLVENALKFAHRQVSVTTAPTPDGRGVQIAVSDDGPGIASEDLPHVFERLYVTRARPRHRESGSGLGLAIVRDLVTAMGGAVAAVPTNPGTTLVVTLPAAGAPAASGVREG